MEFNKREILLYYKPNVKKDKNTYNLAKQVSDHINDVNVLKDPPTASQLKQVLDVLGVDIEKLVERDSDIYKEEYEGKSFDEPTWLNIMVKNPDLIKTPIAILGDRGVLVETPSNVLDLDPKGGYNDINEGSQNPDKITY